MVKQLYFFLLPIFCLACSTSTSQTTILAEPNVDYIITAYDQPLDKRFLITIESKSDKDICLYNGTWPSLLTYRQHKQRGELISQLDAEILVVSKTKNYNPRSSTTGGHCQAETVEEVQKICSQRLESGQKRMSTLPYQYFDSRIFEDSDQDKKLKFSASLPFCDVFEE